MCRATSLLDGQKSQYFHICCANSHSFWNSKKKRLTQTVMKNKILNLLWRITGILATASCLLWRSFLSKLSSSSISFLWSCQITQKHIKQWKQDEHVESPQTMSIHYQRYGTKVHSPSHPWDPYIWKRLQNYMTNNYSNMNYSWIPLIVSVWKSI